MDAGPWKSTNILQQYIEILTKLITNPYKIDAWQSNARNMENDAQMKVVIHQKYMKNDTNKSREMVQKWSAQKLWARRGLGPGVPARGKEFLQRFQVKVLFYMQHHQQKQTSGNQLKSKALEQWLVLARTWRAGRHGAARSIEFACGKVPLRAYRDVWMRRLGYLVLSSDTFAESMKF